MCVCFVGYEQCEWFAKPFLLLLLTGNKSSHVTDPLLGAQVLFMEILFMLFLFTQSQTCKYFSSSFFSDITGSFGRLLSIDNSSDDGCAQSRQVLAIRAEEKIAVKLSSCNKCTL